MSSLDEFIAYIETNVIKPLLEIEESYQGVVEDWASKIGTERPKVVVTLQEVNECSSTIVCEDNECKLVTGMYIPETHIILLNYRSTVDVLLHLFTHHIQAQQIGYQRYAQTRHSETLRLPWSLRPTEIRALALARKLRDTLLTQRVLKLWSDYIKPRIKKIDEEYARVRSIVSNLAKSALPNVQIRYYGFDMLRGRT